MTLHPISTNCSPGNADTAPKNTIEAKTKPKLKPLCKFNNCVHINEPNCAVKKALDEGEIALSRYNSYLSIFNNDQEENYR